jgi:hypothetical protein
MRKAMILGVVTLAGTLASPAFADDFTGFRLGLMMNSDKLDGSYSHSVVAPSATTEAINTERFGYGLFGGWALNKWLAVEAGYHSGSEFNSSPFPEFVDSLDTDPDTEGDEYYLLHQDIKSVQASVVGSFWIGNKFSIFGRAGMMAWRGVVSYGYGDVFPESKVVNARHDDGFAPLFGGGIQTQLDHALIRLEYQQADIGDVAFGSNFSSTDNTYSSLAFSIVWTL